MTLVLDASAFFTDIVFDEDLVTTPSVVEELRDSASRCRYEALLASGLRLESPGDSALSKVRAAARGTGDFQVLSRADIELLALALDRGGTIVTDDFALQNTALALRIATRPIRQRAARRITWRFRCAGCGRYYASPGVCTICGAQIRRKLK